MSIVHIFKIEKKINVIFTREEKYHENSLLFKKLQCCGSGMFIPDPGSKVNKIPDSGSPILIPDPDPCKRIRVFLTQKIVSSCKLSEV
jgi:hypothetical protein